MPAGSPDPDGGQWASGRPAATELIADPFSAFLADLPALLLAGGFEKEDMGKTVQEFVTEKCLGRIYSVLPSQFLGVTIADMRSQPKAGNRAADTCKKLLERNEYRN